MPPKKTAKAAKRKASSPSTSPDGGGNTLGLLRAPHPNAQIAEDNGIVLHRFYPPEMSSARCAAYNENRLPRPIEELAKALRDTASASGDVPVQDAVVHWFKSDLRIGDNRALHLAGQKARQTASGAPVALVGLYVISPEDLDAHLAAPVRVDFILRSLAVLRDDLAALDIPLHVETVPRRRDVPVRIVALLKLWRARHLFANMEYGVDELRSDTRLVRAAQREGLVVEVVHDTCIVPPGDLRSASGTQYSVYTPWLRAWIAHLHARPDLLDAFPTPARNPPVARAIFATLFDRTLPADAPENKRLTPAEKTRFAALWPAGEHEAHARLDSFVRDRVAAYRDRRDFPADATTSTLSPHLAAGTLSARSAVRAARAQNSSSRLDAGSDGIQTWIRELAWRDFYKHVLAHWPYVCMNKPLKPSFGNIAWSYDPARIAAWRAGRTGYPFVDAAMRQLEATGWMPNRSRMVAASFLAKQLGVDWRVGEQHFALRLVDGDAAANTGGWQWCVGAGAAAQPWFRILSPDRQAARFDPRGVYVRAWVDELRGVGCALGPSGSAALHPIHDPYRLGLAADAERAGYPRRIVEHEAAREECFRRYREGLGMEG